MNDAHAGAGRLEERVAVEVTGPGRWRSWPSDTNQNGRTYGGQLLGQALRAALTAVPAGRVPTMMQFLFLQGAQPRQPLDLAVTTLQAGQRFTSVHVRGTQGERTVLDAQVSCATRLSGPAHALPSEAPATERPDRLPPYEDAPAPVREALSLLGGYGRDRNAVIAFRVPAAVPQLSGRGPAHRFRYWMKVAHPLPADAHLHAAAFAYLSDWWLNFCLLAPLVGRTGGRRMYVASLNHALWLHGVPQADRWLHVSAHGLHATGGHGLAIAQYHDEAGRHVATATQQCLLAYVDEAPAARPQSLSSITTERMSGT